MEQIYPAGPQAVPPTLTRPTSKYKRHAWVAAIVLIGFAVLYAALCVWFVVTGYRLLVGAGTGGRDVLAAVIAGVCAWVLALFMIKALAIFKRTGEPDGIEITAADQPRLFEFLQRLSKEAGAPDARRVFVTPRVNAAVFYDLTLWNLLFPSKKNLEIGLGLVNVLTLSEFKAVLAHEFGHFAQRTMAVGRWVYMAQQIAAQVIAKRDALDKALEALSNWDIRVAWVGWILRLIIWSIRSLVEMAFRLVLLAQRALSREMEFQADLVAVSLTGSDALIHALHRLQAADEAWDFTLSFAGRELGRGRTTADLFTVHERALQLLGEVRGDPHFGRVPPSPADAAAGNVRLFKPELAHPSRMWATHPFNHEREENAKRLYVPAPLDDRRAWEVFDDPQALRLRCSGEPIANAKNLPPVASVEESLAALEKEFKREHLRVGYHGIYLGRSITRHAANAEELWNAQATESSAAGALYPESLVTSMEQWRGVSRELAMIQALANGTMKAPEGVIRHRGRELSAKQLPATIRELQAEKRALEQSIQANDRRVRAHHLALAQRVGHNWDAYLKGLASLLHYAEHAAAELLDLRAVLATCVNVETAARRISEKGAVRVMQAANDLQRAMQTTFSDARAVVLDPRTQAQLDGKDWVATLGEFPLGYPAREHLGEWLGVIDGWVAHFVGSLTRAAAAALDQLLLAEREVASIASGEAAATDAPAAARVPARYATLLAGAERERHTKLSWWARFQTADGLLPGVARLGVAGAIVGGVLAFGAVVGETSVVVYNGLTQPVTVEIGGRKLKVGAMAAASAPVRPNEPLHIVASTPNGTQIEAFDVALDAAITRYVYNVAQAMSFVQWTATYGYASSAPQRPVGAPRWTSVDVDHLFEAPPASVNTKGGGASRTVFEALGNRGPQAVVAAISDTREVPVLLAAHVRWDLPNSEYLLHWLALASRLPEFDKLLAARLQQYPEDVAARRWEQDAAGGNRADVCARQSSVASARRDNADWQYLAIRCIGDSAARDAAFVKGARNWPANGWLAYAAGYVYAGAQQWDEALDALARARANLPALRTNAAVEAARIVRFKGGELDARLVSDANGLNQMLDVESQHAQGPTGEAYVHLARGQIDAAATGARSLSAQERSRLLRLAAASDGAPASLVGEVLALPVDSGDDMDAMFATLALALREGRETDRVVAVIRQRIADEDTERVLRFVGALRNGSDPARAEQMLEGAAPYFRGQAFSMGCVLLGQKSPPHWRRAARTLLFAPERPYLANAS